MIFKTSRELVNYVLSHYPYEKILTYCHDMNYKFCFVRGGKIRDIREPSRWDIAKFLVNALSEFISSNLSRNSKTPTKDDARVMDIGLRCQDLNLYFRVHQASENSLTVVFKFDYYDYRFRKYTQPFYKSGWGNPRTKVVFRFRGEEELI